MAMFHLEIKPVARRSGRTATAAAAYRAGESIRDERTGALYNHSKRDDVLHKEIFLPSKLDLPDTDMGWARDRSSLWNAAEKVERQSNSRVAREYQVALPPELSPKQRVTLARTFSREIADRYNVAVDLAIHAPRPEGDQRNFHAHLLATTREVTPQGMGSRTGLDLREDVRSELGLPPSRQEFKALRARWAELTNESLREANVEARVDHRSLEAQGIDREPRPSLPWSAIAAERRGEHSEIAERIRNRHRREYVERREWKQRNAETERPGNTSDTRRTDVHLADTGRVKQEPQTERRVAEGMDARRQQAVQDWLEYRAGMDQVGDREGHERAPPLSMDEIRERAVAAWRSLQARGAESPSFAESRQERERGEAGQARDTPGLGDDFSG